MKASALLLTFATLFTTSAVTLAAGPDPGQPAPPFTLTDTRGEEHSLGDFAGKMVVLEWTNFGCPFVQKHYNSGNMQSLQKNYTGKDVVWLMIASSAKGKQGQHPPEKWNEIIEEQNAAPTAVLLDEDGTVGRLYGATATPGMYVIDKEGTLIYRGAIDSINTADQADIEKATNYVAAALDSAMAGKPVKTASTKPYGCSVKYK